MRTFFSRLKDGLARTREGLVDRIKETIGLRPRLDDELFAELELALIAADCGADLAVELTQTVRDSCATDRVTESFAIIGRLKEAMIALLGRSPSPVRADDRRPGITIFVGVNGTGKTTSIGKIGHHHVRSGKTVMFAAADTFRAAAGEQLEIWAERVGAQMIRSKPGADPAAVAYDAVMAAQARGIDELLIDTAGRLQSKANLMAELAKVKRSVDKARGDGTAAPTVLLVMDATTGQNGLSQAEQFTKVVGVDGIVLTKLDGTAKGGIVLAIAHRLKIPVLWVGVGEGIEDLETFDPQEFVEALLG